MQSRVLIVIAMCHSSLQVKATSRDRSAVLEVEADGSFDKGGPKKDRTRVSHQEISQLSTRSSSHLEAPSSFATPSSSSRPDASPSESQRPHGDPEFLETGLHLSDVSDGKQKCYGYLYDPTSGAKGGKGAMLARVNPLTCTKGVDAAGCFKQSNTHWASTKNKEICVWTLPCTSISDVKTFCPITEKLDALATSGWTACSDDKECTTENDALCCDAPSLYPLNSLCRVGEGPIKASDTYCNEKFLAKHLRWPPGHVNYVEADDDAGSSASSAAQIKMHAGRTLRRSEKTNRTSSSSGRSKSSSTSSPGSASSSLAAQSTAALPPKFSTDAKYHESTADVLKEVPHENQPAVGEAVANSDGNCQFQVGDAKETMYICYFPVDTDPEKRVSPAWWPKENQDELLARLKVDPMDPTIRDLVFITLAVGIGLTAIICRGTICAPKPQRVNNSAVGGGAALADRMRFLEELQTQQAKNANNQQQQQTGGGGPDLMGFLFYNSNSSSSSTSSSSRDDPEWTTTPEDG
ncbi:unnamed protein product [Amoebophrya sp. A25]|nr:unnamed protein product [Amoebophrya sp. A25]|eukprot:GSA25T00023810001.1